MYIQGVIINGNWLHKEKLAYTYVSKVILKAVHISYNLLFLINSLMKANKILSSDLDIEHIKK